MSHCGTEWGKDPAEISNQLDKRNCTSTAIVAETCHLLVRASPNLTMPKSSQIGHHLSSQSILSWLEEILNKGNGKMFDGLNLPAWRAADWGSLVATLVAIILWRRYAIKRDSYAGYNEKNAGNGAPPTFPYVFPFLGTLPISYLWKPRDFVLGRE